MLARIGQANCPGDPGCPGNLDVSNLPLIGPYTGGASPLTAAQLAVSASSLNPASAAPAGGGFLSQVPGGAATLAIGGAVFLLILALPRRR